jgi:hypothetical protein
MHTTPPPGKQRLIGYIFDLRRWRFTARNVELRLYIAVQYESTVYLHLILALSSIEISHFCVSQKPNSNAKIRQPVFDLKYTVLHQRDCACVPN